MNKTKIQKEKTSLIISLIASNSNFYDYIVENYVRKFIQYIDNKNLDVKVYLLYDNNNNYPKDLQQNIFLNPDKNRGYKPGITTKTINFFKYINDKYDYKYLFRSNLSSLIVIERLIEVLNLLPEKDLYAGNKLIYKNINYINGAGIIMSKDRVQYLIDNFERYFTFIYTLIDDVFFGFVFEKNNKSIFDLSKILPDTIIKSEEKSRYEPLNYEYRKYNRFLTNKELEKIYEDMIIGKYYHTRIVNHNNREVDKQIFDYLTKKILS